MRERKSSQLRLGELIVALTDEVMPIIRDPSVMYIVVSFVLSDLLARHQGVAPQPVTTKDVQSGKSKGLMPYCSL